jgi:hypothetical protein
MLGDCGIVNHFFERNIGGSGESAGERYPSCLHPDAE